MPNSNKSSPIGAACASPNDENASPNGATHASLSGEFQSPNGAIYDSPGHRPGIENKIAHSPEGATESLRAGDSAAPAGLGIFWMGSPRALPWAAVDRGVAPPEGQRRAPKPARLNALGTVHTQESRAESPAQRLPLRGWAGLSALTDLRCHNPGRCPGLA